MHSVRSLLYYGINYPSCYRCWVGKRHLDIAMDKLSHENYVFQIKWKPFELNSWLPEDGLTFKEYATMKFGAGSMERFTEEKVPFFERGKQLVHTSNIPLPVIINVFYNYYTYYRG